MKGVRSRLRERPESTAEAALAFQLRAATAFTYQREFRFHPVRLWRSDFAIWASSEAARGGVRPLLVEVEGAVRGKPGRHQRVDGMEQDCEKYAEAQCHGYTVLRVSAGMARDGRALAYIERLMRGGD